MFIEMHHLIKYVHDTRNCGLKIEPMGTKENHGILSTSVIAIMQEIQLQGEIEVILHRMYQVY